MSKTIFIFPTNLPLPPALQQYFAEQDLPVFPYEATSTAPQADAILLSTPILCGGEEWVSPEAVWKNYCCAVNPAVKIIQTGLDNGAPPQNYLHWHQRPEDFGAFLQAAAPAIDWTPYPTHGTALGALWRKFRDGHDKGGFMDWFIAARRRATMVESKLEYDPELYEKMLEHLNLPTTIEAFENLSKRWQRYRALLVASPCQQELATIDAQIAIISEGWGHCAQAKTLHRQMQRFNEAFANIDTQIQRMNAWF